MNEKKKLDSKTLISKAMELFGIIKQYGLLIFVVVVGLVYGFIYFQINSLSNAQPSSEAISSHIKPSQTPHIDKVVVKQLEALQDNSVNVQTLFDNARSNPFQ